MPPPWAVLLLGGASGVGKSSVSHALARHYGIALTEVDDFQVIVEGMTDPEKYPVFHFWRLNSQKALAMSDREQVDFFVRYASALQEALAMVIANHIESRIPVLLEGDFILPSLATRTSYGDAPAEGQVRAVFLQEQDETQIARNYLKRDGREQEHRAHISHLIGKWLSAEASHLGLSVIDARPWDSVVERVIDAVDRGG